MRHLFFLVLIWAPFLPMNAQFEWGGAAGTFLYELRSGREARRGFEITEKA